MKTIQELVISIATTETKMMAEKGRGFNNEEKKSIAKTLSLLFSKGELLEGLAFCYGSFEDEIDSSDNNSWEPLQSSFYNIANILLYLLNMKTFKQYKRDEWTLVYKAIAKRLFY